MIIGAIGNPGRTTVVRYAALLLIGSLCGCRETVPEMDAPRDVRPVRVLLHDNVEGCRVRVDDAYELRLADGSLLRSGRELSWSVIENASDLRIDGAPAGSDAVMLIARRYGMIRVAPRRNDKFEPDRRYAGRLTISARPGGGIRIVNAVDVESYVAGVVACEAPPTFHDESLKGQSISARTYAMYIMSQRADRPYDLVATEGDQVYRGLRLDDFGRRVRDAVNATRGLVLAWQAPEGERVFCAYYSAACGGRSQSRGQVSPGPVPSPLAGRVRCDHCRIAGDNVYTWGPTEIPKKSLLENLKRRVPETANFMRIATVQVADTTPHGRIGNVAITSSTGERVTISGERFRLAVSGRIMRSTACRLVDVGDLVRFTDGHGFGHGVGLCQWGMEGQAREGRRAGEILRFYYPGSKLVRAY